MNAMLIVLALSLNALPGEASEAGTTGAGCAVVPGPATQAAGEPLEEAARILHLRDGGIVRGRARFDGSHWELRADQGWRSIPAEAVVKHSRERDVLERSRALLATARRGEPAQRLMAADWMLREGLADEALRELEALLELDPDHAGVLRMLQAPPVPLAAPGSSSQAPLDALRSLARRPRVVQELGIVALGRRGDREALDEALNRALHSPASSVRAVAGLALRRLRTGERSRELLARAVLDSSEDVRTQAALALRDAREEALLLPLVRALGSEHASVRSNAAEAMGVMGYAAAVEPLISRLSTLSAPQSGGGGWRAPAANIFVGRQVAYVQDYDVEVAQFASIADPQINVALEGSVLDVRVIGVSEYTVAVESRRIRTALGKLTGAQPGSSNRSWLEWWEQNKARWGVPTPPRNGPVSPGGAAGASSSSPSDAAGRG